MHKNLKIHYSSKSDEWETPKHLFSQLNNEFNFKLDAAATKENTLCAIFYDREDNALERDWFPYKSIWCNPPYGRQISKFVEKAYLESQYGATVVLLLPARTDTKWWHAYCSKGEVCFLKGRLKFQNRTFPSWKPDLSHKVSPANFPSAIVIFGENYPTCTKYYDISK